MPASNGDLSILSDSSRPNSPGLKPSSDRRTNYTTSTNTNNMLKPVQSHTATTDFDSSSYYTHAGAVSSTTGASPAVISTLIERGMRLKNEMLKTASRMDLPASPSPKKQISMANVSYLSDELDATNLSLGPILYDGYLFAPGRRKSDISDDDPELRELLEPRDLFSRAQRTNVASEDEFGAGNGGASGGGRGVRVSFEIQSSDAESSCSSSAPVDSCFEVLSAQRIALLNLVQVAKLNLDKLTLFPKTNVSLLVEQSNRPELQLSGAKSSSSSQTNSKPPIVGKNASLGVGGAGAHDPNQLFFVEYQFPVLANSRDPVSELSAPTMATQSMRVVSKR